MNESETQAREVIAALREFRDRFEHILHLLDGKKLVTSDEKTNLQGLLKSLKEDLKQAAKTGTVSGLKKPGNHFEQAYFEPAVFKASANFNVAVNSHPIRSDWFSGLYSVEIDITHLLHQLESQFPDE